MTATPAATLPPHPLPGLDPSWSRLVPVVGDDGVERTWHVLDTGAADAGVTLLCVHGNPTWSYLWRGLLAAAPPRYRVVAPDQLGMGWSERLRTPRTLEQRISDLGRLTTALRVTGPVVTLAHDWGGPISMGWAAQHRAQLRGVVLTNTAVRRPAGSTGPLLIRAARLPGVRPAVCVRTPAFVRAATALSRPRLPRDVRDAFAAPYVGADRRRSVGDFVADIPFGADHPNAAVLDRLAEGTRSLDVPALLLWGPRDPVFGQAYLDDLLDRLPHAHVHRYERAGHLVTEDAPEYAGTVLQWVADLAVTSAPTAGADDAGQPTAGPPTTTGDHAFRSLGRPECMIAGPWPGADDAGAEAGPAAGPDGSLWGRLAARAGDQTPAVVEVGRVSVSWTLLERRVTEIAAGLVAAGVRPGHRVALLVPPSADLTAAVYAVWRAGAVIVVADRGLGVRAMGRALRGARVDHVIATAAGLAAAHLMRLPGTRIAAGVAPRPVLRAMGAELRLADVARWGRDARSAPGASADDECAVVFTSGATGPAKGVVYRHGQVLAQLDLLRSTYGLGGEDRMVAAFAPFALYGPALGIGSAVPDMDVTSPGTLTAAALADAVDAVGGTVVFASPAALRGVLCTAATLSPGQRQALGRVRLLMSAGAPVPLELLRSLHELLPAADLRTPYGMTEVLPVTDISLSGIEAAGQGAGVCVGAPLTGVDVAVSPLSAAGAADAPLTAEPDVTGEVSVRAAHVKDRYDALWGTQRSSARDDGWHRTGDVGHLDVEGRLWVEGRLEHVLTTPAGVVTPVGVEQRVESLPQVQSAAVVGVGPAGTQQLVVVVVPEGWRARRSAPVAPLPLTEAVRRVAGIDAVGVSVAAVLVAARLPVDIRHASKVDRRAVATWAARVLAGDRC